LAAAALVMLVGAGTALFAQSAQSGTSGTNGSITGKLTDLHSMPVEGAVVVARNEATGAEARTTSQKNGIYGFTGLDAGTYTVEAESEQLGRGRLEGIFVTASHETRVQTAMQFELSPPQPIQAVIHDIAPVTPIVNTPIAAQPLHQAAMSERRVVAEMPATTAPVVNVTLAAEPLQQLAVSGWRLPDRAQQTPVAASGAKAETVQTPPSGSGQATSPNAGQTQAAVKPEAAGTTLIPRIPEQKRIGQTWEAGRGLAISEAVAGVAQAAAQLNPPQPRRMEAASREASPVAPVVTTTVSGDELQALPASGRRWQDFVLDTPTAATAAGGKSQTSLRGAGEEPAETSIDGASIRLAFGGQGGAGPGSSGPGSNGQGGAEQNGMGQAWFGGRGSTIAEAAIREVETAAGNAEAEGARAACGSMNVETQRGANGLHGQVFLFDRQNNWGARNPFTQWVKETAPATETTVPVFTPEPYTPPDQETVWSIGMGSQIRRDKLFWFAALDSYHRNDPGLSTVKHPDVFFAQPGECAPACPSADEMVELSARLGLSSVNPMVEGLEAYSTMLETLDWLLGPAPRTAMQWVGFGRLDWQATERHRFTLEGIGARWNSPGGGLTRVSETYGINSFASSQANEEWLLGRWEAFVTPNLLMVTQGSVGHNVMSAHAETPPSYSFEQTLLTGNTWGQLPQINVDNRYGFTIGNPSRFGQGSYPDERLYQAKESVDWVRGSLLVKAGFEVRHNFDATSLLRNQTGTYNYSSVVNFASDALVFQYFPSHPLDPFDQHTCDQTGRVWRDSGGNPRGLGALPCYSYYSQVIGPPNWYLSTNDWAGYASTQWQPNKHFVLSAGLRWEREQMPPPIAKLANQDLPLTEKLPSLGNNWGPRMSLAVGNPKGHWPLLRLGYGMYFGRTENATIETALTQTGSANGDLNIFIRPTDGYNPSTGTSGAPPFPYVLTGEPGSVVKPGAVEFASNFHNPEVHQAVAAVEENLRGHVEVTASAMMSLGRRLPISIDTNFDPAVNPRTITYDVVDSTGLGPIKTPTVKVPFYASWPYADCPSGSQLNSAEQCGRLNPEFQQITQITSKANSTYEAAMLKVVRYGRRGLSLHAHYTYAHAMDWNPNESTLVAGSDVLDPAPANFSLEYGTSNLDIRHSAAAMVVYEAPWKLRGAAGRIGNGWMLSGIGQFHSGLPYTMRTSGSLAKKFDGSTPIVGVGPGMNGSGGDNRVYWLGDNNHVYTIGRNTYRYPATWKADLRLGKKFDLGQMRQLELLAESFNLFNHQNVTELETTGYYLEPGDLSGGLPTLNFLAGLKANTTAFGQPLNINATNFYRERQIQVGVRMRF
jgi:hypothetical protein